MKHWSMLALALAAAVAISSPARAVPLSAGGSVTLTGASALVGTVIATDTQSFDVISNNHLTELRGTVAMQVIRESSGTLDFTYQITNLGAAPGSHRGSSQIHRATVSDFTGFTTDVNYVTSTGQFPHTADRSTDATTVGFGGTPSNFSVSAGQHSAVLFVRTNARQYDELGTFSAINTLTGTTLAFEPRAPEPGTLVLLGGSFVGLGVWRGWRRWRTQPS
jgi:hypothetical protein